MMTPSNDALLSQSEEFKKYLPTWNDEEALAFSEQHGEIVSVAVKPAVPYGTMVKLASKTHSFGPMRLTPIAASNLVRLLAKMAPQTSWT
jgi:hypothetical protein